MAAAAAASLRRRGAPAGAVLAAVLLLVHAAGSEAGRVTPVEKVVSLLKKLEAQVQEEGKEEAATYDKYACFCKEQADNKQYAIERSTEKIAKLDAEIQKLTTEITDLNTDIGKLTQQITDLEGEMQTAQQTRDQEHAEFLTKQADAAGAIDACERAITALEDSKAAMGGKTELEATEAAALVQVRAFASVALGLASRTALSAQQLGQLSALAVAGQPGEAYEYKYHSNNIIATLESLRQTFKKTKLDLEQDEYDANSAFELKQQALANEKKFAEKEKREKEALAEKKTEEKEAKEEDKNQETKEKTADGEFLSVLKTDCEEKATLWDQRSTTRSAELTAISEAMTALKTGVAPNWKANKKLVGLQRGPAARETVPKGHWVYVEEPATSAVRPASFLQIRASSLRGGQGESAVAGKVRALLMGAAQTLKSPLLSAAALKVTVAEDHFVKVRSIIKDLIARLEADASAEASQKSLCDKEMSAAVEKRDTKQADIEDYTAQISAKEAEKALRKEEIAKLSAEIAANKKALLEATELRQNEHDENTKTISEAGAGKEAVEFALKVLKDFYEGQQVLLQRSGYVPPNSDREGKTLADRAPEIFDAEYKGSQEASKGILGMLEVILSDFDRTGTTVTDQEADAESDFQQFKTTNEDDTKTKEGLVETKEGQVTDLKGDLVQLKDDKADAVQDHKNALDNLEKLHAMCVAGEETYEERVAQRQKEIEALKEAHDILENWQR